MIRRFIVGFALVTSIFMTSLALSPGTVSAASADQCKRESFGFLSFPTWYKYLTPEFSDGECKLKVRDAQGDVDPGVVAKILMAVFEMLLRVAGLVAVVFIIHGGIQYIVSQGEPDKVKGARQSIVHALVGLAIATSATAMVNLIARNIT